MTLPPLPNYPSSAAWKSLSPTQLSTTRDSIAKALLETAALPPTKRDTPAARTFISTFAKEQARATLEGLVWGTKLPQEERLIRKRALVLAQKLADASALSLETLFDLAIVYARTNTTQTRAILASGPDPTPPEVESVLVPALKQLLASSQGLYALRKTSYCIECFLNACPKATLRVFAHSKEFIIALATAYDDGLTALAHSYGGLSVSGSRDPDEWERIWVETKVSLVDAFHVIVRSLLDDLASSKGAVLLAEADRTFEIIFALLEVSSSSHPGPSQTPFLDRSLLADYQQTYDLSRTLASSLRHAKEKDARVDLLESSLQSISPSAEKEPGALKILLRSSGYAPGVDNLGKRRTNPQPNAKGKGKDVSAAPTGAEDPELDVKVTQVLDILPEHDPGYIRALFSNPTYTNPSQVIDALLEGTAPPMEELQAQPAQEDHITNYERGNIFNDEAMDLANLRIGKKTENESILRDRTFIEQMKADILRRAEAISDDEEDDEGHPNPTSGTGKGKGKAMDYLDDDDADLDETAPQNRVKVAGDGEESGDESDNAEEEEALTPETICELAYIRDPKLFASDVQTRRSKARADLKTQTGWDDQQLEGWKIMLERDPKKDKILQKHEFAGNQNQIPPSSVLDNSRGGDGERGRGGGGSRGGGGRGRGGAGGRGRGGASGGGAGGEASQRERAWKDKNKASRGNHNRKRGHDKKMARAGGPS